MFRSNLIKLLRSNTLRHQISTLQLQNILNHAKVTNNFCNVTTYKHITSNSHTYQLSKEEEFLVKLKDDSDAFGNSNNSKEIDLDDKKEEKFLETKSDHPQRLRTKQYADIIKDLIRKKKIKEAIDVLEVRMIQEDRVKPDNYIFNLILGACGRVGYTKKAFSLYNKMKQRGLKVTGGTYTALFNACANSPWVEDGLSRANHLRDIMIEKGHEPNDTNYNSMIKAFGRCGDLSMAFQLVDEMNAKKIPIKEDTLNFLLQSCVSDKEAGFRHALLVWRKFYEKRLNPDIFSFNLLLKCTKECNLGDIDVTKSVVNDILKNTLQLEVPEVSQILLNSPNQDLIPLETNHTSLTNTRPNLITKNPHLGNIVMIDEVKTAEDRFLLIGGLSGFLESMHQSGCTPNIKTFTQMLDLIPGTLVMEKQLLVAMKKSNVLADVEFFNMLIKKRSMRFDYEAAKEVLDMMKGSRQKPNIMTYGVLALSCKTKEEAEIFMEEMKEDGHRMNPEILGAMLHIACYHTNFKYVLKIMDTCKEDEIRPNSKFMTCLEKFKRKCHRLSNDKDSKLGQSARFKNGYKIFKMRYDVWKTEVDPISEEEIHPWQQFRETSKTDVKHVKDKERLSRFKPRHNSLYRKKKAELVLNKMPPTEHRGKVQKPETINYAEQKYIEGT